MPVLRGRVAVAAAVFASLHDACAALSQPEESEFPPDVSSEVADGAALQVVFIGCYKDGVNGEHDLPFKAGTATEISQCATLCSGYTYFGRQYYSECWCGNSYGKFGQTTSCGCESSPAAWKNCVYTVAATSTPTSTTTRTTTITPTMTATTPASSTTTDTTSSSGTTVFSASSTTTTDPTSSTTTTSTSRTTTTTSTASAATTKITSSAATTSTTIGMSTTHMTSIGTTTIPTMTTTTTTSAKTTQLTTSAMTTTSTATRTTTTTTAIAKTTKVTTSAMTTTSTASRTTTTTTTSSTITTTKMGTMKLTTTTDTNLTATATVTHTTTIRTTTTPSMAASSSSSTGTSASGKLENVTTTVSVTTSKSDATNSTGASVVGTTATAKSAAISTTRTTSTSMNAAAPSLTSMLLSPKATTSGGASATSPSSSARNAHATTVSTTRTWAMNSQAVIFTTTRSRAWTNTTFRAGPVGNPDRLLTPLSTTATPTTRGDVATTVSETQSTRPDILVPTTGAPLESVVATTTTFEARATSPDVADRATLKASIRFMCENGERFVAEFAEGGIIADALERGIREASGLSNASPTSEGSPISVVDVYIVPSRRLRGVGAAREGDRRSPATGGIRQQRGRGGGERRLRADAIGVDFLIEVGARGSLSGEAIAEQIHRKLEVNLAGIFPATVSRMSGFMPTGLAIFTAEVRTWRPQANQTLAPQIAAPLVSPDEPGGRLLTTAGAASLATIGVLAVMLCCWTGFRWRRRTLARKGVPPLIQNASTRRFSRRESLVVEEGLKTVIVVCDPADMDESAAQEVDGGFVMTPTASECAVGAAGASPRFDDVSVTWESQRSDEEPGTPPRRILDRSRRPSAWRVSKQPKLEEVVAPMFRRGCAVETYSDTLHTWLLGRVFAHLSGTVEQPKVAYNIVMGVGGGRKQRRDNVPTNSFRPVLRTGEAVEVYSGKRQSWLPGTITAEPKKHRILEGYTIKLDADGSESVVQKFRIRRRYDHGTQVSVYKGLLIGWAPAVVDMDLPVKASEEGGAGEKLRPYRRVNSVRSGGLRDAGSSNDQVEAGAVQAAGSPRPHVVQSPRPVDVIPWCMVPVRELDGRGRGKVVPSYLLMPAGSLALASPRQ